MKKTTTTQAKWTEGGRALDQRGYANLVLWTDVEPYEIMRRIGPAACPCRIMEIRRMEATLVNGDALAWEPGGFSGVCKNQREAKYEYASDEQNPIIRMWLQKDGSWKSIMGRHVLSAEPRRFYDYNF